MWAFIRSFIRSFICSFIRSSVHSFTLRGSLGYMSLIEIFNASHSRFEASMLSHENPVLSHLVQNIATHLFSIISRSSLDYWLHTMTECASFCHLFMLTISKNILRDQSVAFLRIILTQDSGCGLACAFFFAGTGIIVQPFFSPADWPFRLAPLSLFESTRQKANFGRWSVAI